MSSCYSTMILYIAEPYIFTCYSNYGFKLLLLTITQNNERTIPIGTSGLINKNGKLVLILVKLTAKTHLTDKYK